MKIPKFTIAATIFIAVLSSAVVAGEKPPAQSTVPLLSKISMPMMTLRPGLKLKQPKVAVPAACVANGDKCRKDSDCCSKNCVGGSGVRLCAPEL